MLYSFTRSQEPVKTSNLFIKYFLDVYQIFALLIFIRNYREIAEMLVTHMRKESLKSLILTGKEKRRNKTAICNQHRESGEQLNVLSQFYIFQ